MLDSIEVSEVLDELLVDSCGTDSVVISVVEEAAFETVLKDSVVVVVLDALVIVVISNVELDDRFVVRLRMLDIREPISIVSVLEMVMSTP